jgi:hypothetical protein
VRSTEEALALLRAALDGEGRQVAVLPLDAQRRGSRIVRVDRLPGDDAVLEVVDLTLDTHLRTASPLHGLVLATRRSGRVGWPSADDWWRYALVVERCELAGVELLDWFLLGGGGATSLAELDGREEARWAPSPPSS